MITKEINTEAFGGWERTPTGERLLERSRAGWKNETRNATFRDVVNGFYEGGLCFENVVQFQGA